jgi:hypothetical protein
MNILPGDFAWRVKSFRHFARVPHGTLVIAFLLKPDKFLAGPLAAQEVK